MSTSSWQGSQASGNARQHNGNVYNYYQNQQSQSDGIGSKATKPQATETQLRKHQQLWNAAGEGQLPRVTYLLSQGADMDYIHNGSSTAFHQAARNGHLPVVNLLITTGADINSRTPTGKVQYVGHYGHGATALHLASLEGHVGVVEALIAASSIPRQYIETREFNGLTALHLASMKGHTSVAKALLAAGAEVNSKSHAHYQETSLHLACTAGKVELVNVLLDAGAEVDAEGRTKDTPLHYAAASGSKDAAERLLLAGADINHPGCLDWTPLGTALEKKEKYGTAWDGIVAFLKSRRAKTKEEVLGIV